MQSVFDCYLENVVEKFNKCDKRLKLLICKATSDGRIGYRRIEKKIQNRLYGDRKVFARDLNALIRVVCIYYRNEMLETENDIYESQSVISTKIKKLRKEKGDILFWIKHLKSL